MMRAEYRTGGMGLALVVIEENARRAVQLGNDDAFGAVDDECPLVGHQRQCAKVNFLFLDAPANGFRAGFLILIVHFQGHADFQGGLVSHALGQTLVHLILHFVEAVGDELQIGQAGKVTNGKHALKHGLEALIGPLIGRNVFLQKTFVGAALHFDQVGHIRDLIGLAEIFADTQIALIAGHLLLRSYLVGFQRRSAETRGHWKRQAP